MLILKLSTNVHDKMNKKQDKDKTFVKLYNYFVVDFVTQIFNPQKIMNFLYPIWNISKTADQ